MRKQLVAERAGPDAWMSCVHLVHKPDAAASPAADSEAYVNALAALALGRPPRRDAFDIAGAKIRKSVRNRPRLGRKIVSMSTHSAFVRQRLVRGPVERNRTDLGTK